MVRVRWIIGVAAVTTLAVAATFLPRPVTEAVPAGPAPTPLGWTAQLQPLAGDGVPGLRDGAPAQARFSDPYALLALDDGGLRLVDAQPLARQCELDGAGHATQPASWRRAASRCSVGSRLKPERA